MPKMSDTMEEGVISVWLKKEGDEVKSGDILAEVETDKATMELESYEDGTLLYVGVKDGESVPVDGVIAIIGEKGEDITELLKKINTGVGIVKPQPVDEPTSGEVEVDIDVSTINASVITMPKMSDTMTEGTIASWLKKVGDEIKSGDILAEVETDKATMELEAYEDGTLLYIGVEEGNSVAVDDILAVIGEKGADFESLIKSQESKKATPAEEVSEKPVATTDTTDISKSKDAIISPSIGITNGRVIASPLAKKLASEKGYDLKQIQGSGDNGRIIKRDIEAFVPSQASVVTPESQESPSIQLPAIVGEESYEEINVSQMRKTIAKRLAESKFTSPHFYLTMEINMDKAIAARKSMNDISPVKISFNDIIIKACAAALRQHPKVNVSWLEDKIRFNKHIHIGVAVAVEEGLLVPVVRFADSKTISHISAEVKQLGEKARNKQLQPSDWEGNTFTISNLGMFGIEEFTAIINPPDACILAVGGIKETAIVKDGQVASGNVMKVTMSCDHRVVDGVVGSAFLQTLKQLLEDPVRIMV